MTDIRVFMSQVRSIFTDQRLAVLSTHSAGQPYASLVAFAASEDLKTILFATTRSTRKFANLTADSRVALLVDNRSNKTSDFYRASAVTAVGTAGEVESSNRDQALRLYLSRHPELTSFVSSPSCALLSVSVETYFIVNRFQNVQELHIRE